MLRTLSGLLLGTALCAASLFSADAQEAKKSEKHDIKGGIEGKVKKVDAAKETLTMTMADGKERTFTISEDTTMVGPKGGVVRRRLKDPRFHEGLEIIIVATGNAAKEVHLGYDRREETPDQPKTTAKGTTKSEDKGKDASVDKTKKTDTKTTGKTLAKGKTAKEEDEEDDEFPGKIKSVDASKHMLVITLLNGKDRSFLVSGEAKMMVKGITSKKGLEDPALKAGASVTVVTDAGGRKVKEVKVTPAPATKTKKAG